MRSIDGGTQTQQAHSEALADIFGADDDDDLVIEENDAMEKAMKQHKLNDEYFGVSDSESDDGAPQKKRKGKLIRRESAPKKKKISKPKYDDIIITKEKPKKKISRKERSSDSKTESGDEYDSGDEVVATKEDEDFIDNNDELKDIVDEYDEEKQEFDDEKPGKIKKKPVAQRKVSSANGPKLDDKIAAMLNTAPPKPKALGEEEILMYVKSKMSKIDQAARKDRDARKLGVPAMNRINILPEIKEAMAVKEFRDMLIKEKILSRLREWIVPVNGELPSLPLRSDVYKVIELVDYDQDHIKSSNLGGLLLQLSKHPDETKENKKLLSSIMAYWYRSMHGYENIRGLTTLEGNEELKIAASRQKIRTDIDIAPVSGTAGDVDSSEKSATPKKAAAQTNLFQVPLGYVFTVDPKNETKVAAQSELKGVNPTLMKIIRGKAGSKGSNFRAFNVDINGKDKQ